MPNVPDPEAPEYEWINPPEELASMVPDDDPRGDQYRALLSGNCDQILVQPSVFCAAAMPAAESPAIDDYVDGNWLAMLVDYALANAYCRLCSPPPPPPGEGEAMLQQTSYITTEMLNDSGSAPIDLVAAPTNGTILLPAFTVCRMVTQWGSGDSTRNLQLMLGGTPINDIATIGFLNNAEQYGVMVQQCGALSANNEVLPNQAIQMQADGPFATAGIELLIDTFYVVLAPGV